MELPLTTQGKFEPQNFAHVPLLNRLYIFGGLAGNLMLSHVVLHEHNCMA